MRLMKVMMMVVMWQGEFVAIGRLEATYSGNSDLIQQMYIYGSARRAYLLAAVVPSKGASPELAHASCSAYHRIFSQFMVLVPSSHGCCVSPPALCLDAISAACAAWCSPRKRGRCICKLIYVMQWQPLGTAGMS